MAARITSDVFVSGLIRTVQQQGGFATVVRKGDPRGGAVHILVADYRSGTTALYAPAPQAMMEADPDADGGDRAVGGRLFAAVEPVPAAHDLDAYVAREARFDSDFWLVELETALPVSDGLFSIVR